jgi:hypothetical protein
MLTDEMELLAGSEEEDGSAASMTLSPRQTPSFDRS